MPLHLQLSPPAPAVPRGAAEAEVPRRLSDLPVDVLVAVAAFLEPAALSRLRRAARLFDGVARKFAAAIFRAMLRRDFRWRADRGGDPREAYRVADNLRRGRARARLLTDSDAFVEGGPAREAAGTLDAAAMLEEPAGPADDPENVDAPGDPSLKRGGTSSGESSRSSSPDRTRKRRRRVSRLELGDKLVEAPGTDAPARHPVRRIWHKRQSFMAWPADPSDAYLLVLENDFLFLLDSNRPMGICVYDLHEDTLREPAQEGGRSHRVLRTVAVLPNPPPVPAENPGMGPDNNPSVFGLILGNGKGSLVAFDEGSQISIWDSFRRPEPEFRLRLLIAAGTILGPTIFSMNVWDDFVVTAGRFGQVVVFDMRTGDAVYAFDVPRPYRPLEPAPPAAEVPIPPPAPAALVVADAAEAEEDAADEPEDLDNLADIGPAPADAPVQAEPPVPHVNAVNLMNVAMSGDQIAVAVHDGTWWVWKLPEAQADAGEGTGEPARGSLHSIVRRGQTRNYPVISDAFDDGRAHFPPGLPVLRSWLPEEPSEADQSREPVANDEVVEQLADHGVAILPPHAQGFAPETLAMTSHVLITNGPDKHSIGLWDLSPVADSQEAERARRSPGAKPRVRCSKLSVLDLFREQCEPGAAANYSPDLRFAEISTLCPGRPTVVASVRGRRLAREQGEEGADHALAVWDFGEEVLSERPDADRFASKWEKVGLLPEQEGGDGDGNAEIFWAWVGFACEAEDRDG